MAITMTDFAVEKISLMLKRQRGKDASAYFRIGLQSGGCSGYSYLFEFTDSCEKHDRILEFGELKVCIDKKSYLFLNGMEIDYEETPFKSGIKLSNPAVTRTCGCGESVAF